MNTALAQLRSGFPDGTARVGGPSCVTPMRGKPPLDMGMAHSGRLLHSPVSSPQFDVCAHGLAEERSGGIASTSFSFDSTVRIRGGGIRPKLGRITPAKLAAISELLHMPLKMVETLVDKNPRLVSVEPEELRQRMQDLSRALGLKPREVTNMVSKQPMLLFGSRPRVSRSGVGSRSLRRNDSSSLESSHTGGSGRTTAAASSNTKVFTNGRPQGISPSSNSLNALRNCSGRLLSTPSDSIPSHVDDHSSDSDPACAIQPGEAVQNQARYLAQELKVSEKEIFSWAVTAPSILRRNPDVIVQRVRRFAEMYGLDIVPTGRLVCAAPQHFTDSYACIERRLEALCTLTGKDRRAITKMLRKQPDLVCVSSRILVNKTKVLQAILEKKLSHVVKLVLVCPALLHTDLTHVQSIYKWLPNALGKEKGFVYAMVCRNPSLLMDSPTHYISRLNSLYKAFFRCSEWEAEWKKLSPAKLADCLSGTCATFARLDYLVARQAEGEAVMSLEEVLIKTRQSFDTQFPDFSPLLAQHQRAASSASTSPTVSGMPTVVPPSTALLTGPGGLRPAGMSMKQWQHFKRRYRTQQQQKQKQKLHLQKWQDHSNQLDSILYNESWQKGGPRGSGQQQSYQGQYDEYNQQYDRQYDQQYDQQYGQQYGQHDELQEGGEHFWSNSEQGVSASVSAPNGSPQANGRMQVQGPVNGYSVQPLSNGSKVGEVRSELGSKVSKVESEVLGSNVSQVCSELGEQPSRSEVEVQIDGGALAPLVRTAS
eukprot:gene24077-9655_t